MSLDTQSDFALVSLRTPEKAQAGWCFFIADALMFYFMPEVS
jgi:hypothetical protein